MAFKSAHVLYCHFIVLELRPSLPQSMWTDMIGHCIVSFFLWSQGPHLNNRFIVTLLLWS
jgi:hypothetical protein